MSNTESVDALTDENGALLAAVLDQTHDCIKLLDRDGVIQKCIRSFGIKKTA